MMHVGQEEVNCTDVTNYLAEISNATLFSELCYIFRHDCSDLPGCYGNDTDDPSLYDNDLLGGMTSNVGDILARNLPIMILALVALIMNVFEIVFIRRRRSRQAFDILLASLAVADAMFSLLVIIIEIIVICEEINDGQQNVTLADIFTSFVHFSMFSSIIHVVIIAAERLWAVTKPFKHKASVSRKFLIVTTSVIWLTTFIIQAALTVYKFTLSKSQRLTDTVSDRTTGIFSLVTGTLLCLLYIRLIWQVHQHRKFLPQPSKNADPQRTEQRLQSYMPLITGAMLSAAFVICMFPTAVIMACQLEIGNAWTVVTNCLLAANSLFNPLAYFWRGYWVRMKRVRRRARQFSEESVMSTTFGSTSVLSNRKQSVSSIPDLSTGEVTPTRFRAFSSKWHGW